jgi:hypothetical protein
MVRIPSATFREQLAQASRLSYGAVRATVILASGRRVPDVILAWGRDVVRCGGTTEIPFTEEEIADVELDHAQT